MTCNACNARFPEVLSLLHHVLSAHGLRVAAEDLPSLLPSAGQSSPSQPTGTASTARAASPPAPLTLNTGALTGGPPTVLPLATGPPSLPNPNGEWHGPPLRYSVQGGKRQYFDVGSMSARSCLVRSARMY